MVMAYYDSEKFKKLQEKWYDKLDREGFKDVETNVDGKLFLREFHSSYFQRKYSPLRFRFKQQYYQNATRFTHIYEFTSDRDRLMWIAHADGVSVRKIASKFKVKIWVAHQTINKLATIMKKLFANAK